MLLRGLVFLAFAGVVTSPASAAESLDGCANRTITTLPASIGTPGRWCLAADHSTAIASGAAITIAASNVILDCNGFGVTGTADRVTTRATGVVANGHNVTVRGCRVTGFSNGIVVVGDSALVDDVRVRAMRRIGVRVVGDGGLVRASFVRDIGDLSPVHSSVPRTIGGILAEGSVDVIDNTVDGVSNHGDGSTEERAHGIRVVGAHGALVRDNRVRNVWSFLSYGRAGIHLGENVRGAGVFGNDLYETGIGVECKDAWSGHLRETTVQDATTVYDSDCREGESNFWAPAA